MDEPFEDSEGNLSTGGIFWHAGHDAHGREVDVRVRLPGLDGEIPARGEIVGRRAEPGGAGFHVRFTQLRTEDELAIARYIDEVMVGWE